MKNIDTRIKITFKSFKDIFEIDRWSKDCPPFKKSSKKLMLYIPNENIKIHEDTPSGLKLKDGVGYIRIQEELNKEGIPVSYMYSFISSEYDYLIAKNNNENALKSIDGIGCFCFHFQKDEDNNPHEPHISVMNPSAFRYPSGKISLEEFLSFIRNSFYLPSGNKRDNLLLNRL